MLRPWPETFRSPTAGWLRPAPEFPQPSRRRQPVRNGARLPPGTRRHRHQIPLSSARRGSHPGKAPRSSRSTCRAVHLNPARSPHRPRSIQFRQLLARRPGRHPPRGRRPRADLRRGPTIAHPSRPPAPECRPSLRTTRARPCRARTSPARVRRLGSGRLQSVRDPRPPAMSRVRTDRAHGASGPDEQLRSLHPQGDTRRPPRSLRRRRPRTGSRPHSRVPRRSRPAPRVRGRAGWRQPTILHRSRTPARNPAPARGLPRQPIPVRQLRGRRRRRPGPRPVPGRRQKGRQRRERRPCPVRHASWRGSTDRQSTARFARGPPVLKRG